jgi:hypothetical protein
MKTITIQDSGKQNYIIKYTYQQSNKKYINYKKSFIKLSNNSKTDHKSRELHTVDVDAEGKFLKLRVHKNFPNDFNIYNQV